MCFGGSPAPYTPPPSPPAAPKPTKIVERLKKLDDSGTASGGLKALRGRSALRIDRSMGSSDGAGAGIAGLNVP